MATNYYWARLLENPASIPVLEPSPNPYAVYFSDFAFGVGTIINPLPSGTNIRYVWAQKVTRGSHLVVHMEWEYLRTSSTRTLRARAFNEDGSPVVHGGTDPNGWVNQSATLGASSVYLGSYNTTEKYRRPENDPEAVESIVPGTALGEFEYRENDVLMAGGFGSPAGVLGRFDIRTLAVRNLRAEKPVTNLSSEENTVNIKGDIYALPGETDLFPAWTPVSDIDLELTIRDIRGQRQANYPWFPTGEI